jgi:hypothetical protein
MPGIWARRGPEPLRIARAADCWRKRRRDGLDSDGKRSPEAKKKHAPWFECVP